MDVRWSVSVVCRNEWIRDLELVWCCGCFQCAMRYYDGVSMLKMFVALVWLRCSHKMQGSAPVPPSLRYSVLEGKLRRSWHTEIIRGLSMAIP